MRRLESLMLATALVTASCATISEQKVQPVEAQRNISSREVSRIQALRVVQEYVQQLCKQLNVICDFTEKHSVFEPGNPRYGDPFEILLNHPEEHSGNAALKAEKVKWWVASPVMLYSKENPSKHLCAVFAAVDDQGQVIGFASWIRGRASLVKNPPKD